MSSCKTPFSEMTTQAHVHPSPYLYKSRGKMTFLDIREEQQKSSKLNVVND